MIPVPPEVAERILTEEIFWHRWRIRACFALWWACIMTLLLTGADMVLTWGYPITPIFRTGDRFWLMGLATGLLWAVDWAGDMLHELLDEAQYTLGQVYGIEPTDDEK